MSLFGDIGKALGNVLKPVGQIAGIANPILKYIPGAGNVSQILTDLGKAGSVAGALSAGSHAQGQADDANALMQAIAQRQLAAANQSGEFSGAAMQNILPWLSMITDPAYSDLEDPYSKENIDASIRDYQEDQGKLLTNALAQANMMNTNAGVVDSSQARNAALRASVNNAEAVNDYARQARLQGGEKRYQIGKAKEDAQVQRLMQLIPYMLSSQGQQMQGLGGAGNTIDSNRQYSSNMAGMFGDSVAKTVGALSSAGQIGTSNTGKNAGNNSLGTNQVGRNPYAPGEVGGVPYNPTMPVGTQGTSGVGYGTSANPLLKSMGYRFA